MVFINSLVWRVVLLLIGIIIALILMAIIGTAVYMMFQQFRMKKEDSDIKKLILPISKKVGNLNYRISKIETAQSRIETTQKCLKQRIFDFNKDGDDNGTKKD